MIRATRRRSITRWCGFGAFVAMVAACREAPPSPVQWNPDQRASALIAPGSTLVFGAGDRPAIAAAPVLTRWPDDTLACDSSFRAAPLRGDSIVVAWRTRGKADTTRLVGATTGDGGIHWTAPQPLESWIALAGACGWPPVAIGADPSSGRTYVALAPDGVRGVALIGFGGGRAITRRIVERGRIGGPVSVAADSGRVALGYALASADGSRVWLALLTEAGQIAGGAFAVSAEGVRAGAPAVALRGSLVAIAWNESGRNGAPPAAVARTGRVAW